MAKSLAAKARRHQEVSVLLWVTAVLLFAGYALPVMAVEKFALWQDDYSLLAGTWAIYKGGDLFIALIIFFFSIIFPAAKLLLLALVWYLPVRPARRDRALRWMHHLGRWSMLDVFVVAILLVMSKASFLVAVQPRIGVYLFTGAIVLSMILTFRIDQLQLRYERRA